MPRLDLPMPVILDLCRYLGREQPAEQVEKSLLVKRKLLPPDFSWEPEVCLQQGQYAYLIHPVMTSEIPDWVKGPVRRIHTRYPRTKLVVLVRRADAGPVWRIARDLTNECDKLQCGLAVELSDGACLAFPPGCTLKRRRRRGKEAGHIPSWIIDRLLRCNTFSDYLKNCLIRFARKYRKATSGSAPAYDDECDLLLGFARNLKRGDPRLFVPLGLLDVLKETERQRRGGDWRDHFFHTFNNLFLGYIILGDLFFDRSSSKAPDRYIRDTKGVAKLRRWEALWFLTCLFHDPGYMAEKIWVTMEYAYGFPGQLGGDERPPEHVREALVNAWDTQHKEAAENLIELYQRLRKERDWKPHRYRQKEAEAFNNALRKTYFDGNTVGHSLQSGLYLMEQCVSDPTPKRHEHVPVVAETACCIAALSMMFHDQHCREIMRQNKISSLSFENLPYAAVLMFVDSLQDDRRDIKKNIFRKVEVLEDLTVVRKGKKKSVQARVRLHELPSPTWWAGKIEEYESVIRWINFRSKTKFFIDYRTRAWE